MELHYRQQYSKDWQNVVSRQGLEEMGVTFVDITNTTILDHADEHSINITIHVQEKEENYNSSDSQVSNVNSKELTNTRTAIVVRNVMSNLPEVLQQLDVYITVTGTNSHCLIVGSDKAKITNVNNEETSLAIAKVVRSLPEYLQKRVIIHFIPNCACRRTTTKIRFCCCCNVLLSNSLLICFWQCKLTWVGFLWKTVLSR